MLIDLRVATPYCSIVCPIVKTLLLAVGGLHFNLGARYWRRCPSVLLASSHHPPRGIFPACKPGVAPNPKCTFVGGVRGCMQGLEQGLGTHSPSRVRPHSVLPIWVPLIQRIRLCPHLANTP